MVYAEATVALLKDPVLRTKLGEDGRRLVLERYDWRQIYNILDDSLTQRLSPRIMIGRPSQALI